MLTLCVSTFVFATSSRDAVASDAGARAPAPTEQQRFLHHLIAAGDWPGLRTEGLRLSFHHPDDAPVWGFYVGWAELQLGALRPAAYRFTDLADEGPAWLAPTAGIAAAQAWRVIDSELGRRRYAELKDHPDPDVARAATLGLAWTAADGARFREVDALVPEVDAMVDGWVRRPRWRRAGVAGVLSAVVPGAGQLYAGAAPEGVAAFFVVGGLTTGTVLLARNPDRRAGAIAMGVFAGSFYLGNIYGAIDAAVRRNRVRRRRVRAAIEDLESPIWPDLPPTAAAGEGPG